MKKILKILVIFALGFLVTSNINQVFAAAADCSTFKITNIKINPSSFTEGDGTTQINISMDASEIPSQGYLVKVFDDRASIWAEDTTEWVNKTSSNTTLNFTLDSQEALTGDDWGATSKDTHHVYLFNETDGENNRWCHIGTYVVSKQGFFCTEPIVISQKRTVNKPDGGTEVKECFYNGAASCLDINSPISFEVSGVLTQGSPSDLAYVAFSRNNTADWPDSVTKQNASPPGHLKWSKTLTANNDNSVWLINDTQTRKYEGYNCGGANFQVINSCPADECDEKPTGGEAQTLGPDVFDLCSQIPEAQSEQRSKCIECAGGINGRAGIWTAIGCIKRDPKVIIRSVINLGLGIGGGIALVTFLAAGFIFSTSQGSPERVKNAKEMMTSSVIGLLFVIFSVAMLQFIGWSILKIPGFGG